MRKDNIQNICYNILLIDFFIYVLLTISIILFKPASACLTCFNAKIHLYSVSVPPYTASAEKKPLKTFILLVF